MFVLGWDPLLKIELHRFYRLHGVVASTKQRKICIRDRCVLSFFFTEAYYGFNRYVLNKQIKTKLQVDGRENLDPERRQTISKCDSSSAHNALSEERSVQRQHPRLVKLSQLQVADREAPQRAAHAGRDLAAEVLHGRGGRPKLDESAEVVGTVRPRREQKRPGLLRHQVPILLDHFLDSLNALTIVVIVAFFPLLDVGDRVRDPAVAPTLQLCLIRLLRSTWHSNVRVDPRRAAFEDFSMMREAVAARTIDANAIKIAILMGR